MAATGVSAAISGPRSNVEHLSGDGEGKSSRSRAMTDVTRKTPEGAVLASMRMDNVSQRMAKGAAWMVFLRLADRSIGLISTIILARLLVPEDFGLVTMAMALIAVVELLQAFSFDVALIQNRGATREHYDTAWTLNMLFALSCAVFLLVLASPAGEFFSDERIASIVMWLALGSAAQGFENIGVVAFRKELELHKDFWLQLSRRIMSFVITITAAIAFRSYWALVIGIVSGKILGVGLTYFAHSYRPRFCLARIKELLGFSKWLFVNNLIIVLNARAADFIIGKLAGPSALGLYSIALEMSNLPTTELSAPINRAVFPGYAAMSGDVRILRGQFLKVFSMIGFATIPAAVGVAAVAPALVLTVLGEKWMASVPLVEMLAFYGLLMSLQTNVGYVFVSRGQPRLVTLLGGAHVAVLISLLVLFTMAFGIAGAAWAMLVTTIGMLPFVYGALFRVLGIEASDLLKVLWRPSFASLCMYIAVRLLETSTLLGSYSVLPPINLLQSIMAGVVMYAMIVMGLWIACGRPEGTESLILRLLASRLQHGGKSQQG
jgi:O-antigen/teichoic acid export membrane protein